MILKKIISMTALLVLFGGCSLAPDYIQPEMDLPESWSIPDLGEDSDDTPLIQASLDVTSEWWKYFNDPILNEFVDKALKNNLSIEQAAARVEQARAQYGSTNSNLFPVPAISASTSTNFLKDKPTTSTSLTGGISSWELDFWGEYRNKSSVDRAAFLSSKAALEGVKLSVVSETVNAYFWYRAYSLQLLVAEEVVKSREESYRIYLNRFNEGTLAEFDLLRAEAEVESAKNTVYNIKIGKNSYEGVLAVLVGSSPKEIFDQTDFSQMFTSIDDTIFLLSSPVIPENLPSEILMRRPDIIQAEQALMASNANIGVAKSAYFPSVSLTGLIGSVTSGFGNLFSTNTGLGEVGAGIYIPLNIWKINSNVDGAEAKQRESIAAYKQTVQNAFLDVRLALVQQEQYSYSAATLKRQTDILFQSVEHAQNRYNSGYSSYLELMDAERTLFSTLLQLITAEANSLISISNLCVSLGGGWDVSQLEN